ncbi:CENP-B homolog protein 2-like [Solanum dulcamara]|uniref:CENP-B homolog protein 2-like n=1 Tax=Solanum dulcamara TaxID=45834 RepID=UPI00248566B3|nr:CENP-B homolog protein 2-like [Solanum dulcamara]
MYGKINPKFSFSSGWLERFKSRYGIKSYKCFGESHSVIMENIENKLPSIWSKLDQFELKDIYNMDETRLFYLLKVDHSLATKQLEGRKKDKERITLTLCCNGDRSHKVPLWIIGKFANPRCFKNVNMTYLNCTYISNKKAWMTGLLFQEYVGWFDKRMNGKKVLLIVDNCLAHPTIVEGLRNVELFSYLLTQRLRFNHVMLELFEHSKLIIIVVFISASYKHCKIQSKENNVPEPQVGELDEGIQELNDVISNLAYRNMMDVEHLLNYPNENDTVMESPAEEEIIQSVMNNDDENNLGQDDRSIVPRVSSKEAFQAMTTLSNYLVQHE